MNIERTVPLRFIEPIPMPVGTESTEITEFLANSDLYVFKMVEPLAFHMPREIEDIARSIKSKTDRALFVAEFKKNQYEILKSALGDHIATTRYFVFEEDTTIYVGILQNKINGPTLESLEENFTIPDEYQPAHKEFKAAVRRAASTNISQTSLLELFYAGNLIYEPDKGIVVAVDW